MVVGNGMVAKRFQNYSQKEGFVIFASGVSNSKSIDRSAYVREFALLKEEIATCSDKTLVYFSTTSVYDPSEQTSDYVLHKKAIEEFIATNAEKFTIFRVSNLVGRSNNPNTVLNFFVQKIRDGLPFALWEDASRNLLDIDDFFHIVDYILLNNLFANRIVNIANPKNFWVTEIVTAVEHFLKRKANYTTLSKGCSFTIDISEIKPVIATEQIEFGDDYVPNLLHKYYSDK